MRISRAFSIVSQFALLTASLVSCGEPKEVNMVPQPGTGVVTQPVQAAVDQIATVSVQAGTTEADLLSRYPGAQVLALHADEGYAQLLGSAETLAAPVVSGLSFKAQALAVKTIEPNSKVFSDTSVPTAPTSSSAWAGGTSAWAGGTSAWAGGTSAWAGGVAGTGGTAALAGNASIWTKLDLGTAQKQSLAIGQGVFVAVLDTGVDINHPGLATHLNTNWGWDYVGNDANPQEENWATSGYSPAFGHGTAVTGIILQVAPNVTILPYRVLNPNGEGNLSNIIAAINDAVWKGAKVINLSLGTTTPSAALSTAISSAIKSGAMVVASSGNSGDSNVTYPARYSPDMQLSLGGGLLSVGSTNGLDQKSSFSTYGPSVDLLAPGEAVVTAFPNNQLTHASGTSFAAPMVSGAVALKVAAARPNVMTLYKNIRATATATTDLKFLNMLGKGTVNIGKLMVSP